MAKGSRSSDEKLLSLLRARTDGESLDEIAARHGMTRSHISSVTSRIRRADEACEGRSLEGYWG